MSEAETNNATPEDAQNEYIEDGKNKLIVKCKFCGSKILEKKTATYILQEKELPLMQQDVNRKEGEIQKEMVKEYFHVENMYMFENIGFTHQVDSYKYLTCADCDAGPVGYFEIDSKQSYVALSRVVQC
ncbi:guanine nucleotide exchange factor MSS4 homolog [Plodia interpunctella]|uniref:guanine nucleotide exchange factor MSS4 homolog n=1 Tax=Plodia interpunctella TaxID=58824 RepID=UPI002368C2D3|nr:guanine nucleotide exchange factor MSS4 homolog [Plodia interpunctella]